ncbi:selenium-dependent molybdenum cofactor biosynthesis protein YqeB [Spirochaetota bacterium]
MELFAKAAELAAANIPFAIATIIEASGSTPRDKAKILVTSSGLTGTIGGGAVELAVIEEARRAIAMDKPVMLDYTLDNKPGSQNLQMECGGSMRIYVEVFGSRPRILIIGAGHVGQAIAKAAKAIDYQVAIVDDRPDYATSERLLYADELYVDEKLDNAMAAAPIYGRDCIVVATPSHRSDEEALRHYIGAEYLYLGVLGSRRKVAVMFSRMLADGIPEEQLGRVKAPIGLDLGAETPEEIAVSVLSEIMTVVSGKDGAPLAGKKPALIVVRGAGDIATGVIVRLKAAGFRVAALEIARPTAIRRTVALCEAVYDGESKVEGVLAKRVASLEETRSELDNGAVPILVDPDSRYLPALAPLALVDATLSKHNSGIKRGMAPIVIGLGPGFEAGADVDAVIETQRGHDLGRVILNGRAADNTGVPGEIGGKSIERVIKASAAGVTESIAKIGELVQAGDPVIGIRGPEGLTELRSSIAGVVRGAIRPGLEVPLGMKIADVDPRGCTDNCYSVSDKARAIGGAVLEAILALKGRQKSD